MIKFKIYGYKIKKRIKNQEDYLDTKKYKVIVLDKYDEAKPLPEGQDENIMEINFYTEESKIYFYEDMKGKYSDCWIKMMVCQ